MTEQIGFMQGRLCERVDGKIQAFPWRDWKSEFPAAASIGLHLMEWTLDQDMLYDNPLLTPAGQEEIRALCDRYSIAIPSLTGDCFMQAPFWKAEAQTGKELQNDFAAVVEACHSVGIRMLVVPLVDNGRLETLAQEDALVNFLLSQEGRLQSCGVSVIFESDFAPSELARFIGRLPSDMFGINYDIGNSAGMGFQPKDEFAAYGHRITNVHVKDRVLGGTTVALGTGNAQLEIVFSELANMGYLGNFILQTARATDGSHSQTLCRYKDITQAWMVHFGLINSAS
jgi:L-ribulose-5-phosphate 3-epimerase